MRKHLYIVASALLLLVGCASRDAKIISTITGVLKNAADQKIYVEHIWLDGKAPELVDSALINKSKFSITIKSSEEGLYCLRPEKSSARLLFINDQKDISLKADLGSEKFEDIVFESPANKQLKEFLLKSTSFLTSLEDQGENLELIKEKNESDSVFLAAKTMYDQTEKSYKDYLLNLIQTQKSPTLVLLGLGYQQGIDAKVIDKIFAGLPTRFPDHKQIMEAVKVQQEAKKEAQKISEKLAPGKVAPEISMPDTEGNIFSLSQLRGKYVLIDFWASWCGPCRQENPNVAAAYQEFKEKNFTVLGVSLDKDKNEWLQAIHDDGLVWKHISDLKYWNSAATELYNLEGIPFNVLIDPQGKILATDLRGGNLEKTLREHIK